MTAARSLVVVGVALCALSACGGEDLPDVDVAAAAQQAEAQVAVDDVLADGGWAEVAAFVRDRVDEGRPTLVNGFASWCEPCRDELPVLVEAAAANDDVTFLGVAHQDRRDDAQTMVDEFGVPYATVFDRVGETVVELGGIGMPVTVLFDADGELVRQHVGGLTADELDAWLAPLGP